MTKSPATKLFVAPTAPSVKGAAGVGALFDQPSAERISVEVAVVGTGAGGAVFGTTCAEAGLKTAFFERGAAFGVRDFAKPKMTRSLRERWDMHLAMGSIPIMVPTGRAVGGSTVLNSGICFRPPDVRLNEWSTHLGDPGHAPAAMGPVVDEMWRRLGIAPTPASVARRHNLLFKKGAERTGLEHAFMDRNAPTCIGCGVCHVGCPSGGKASVDKSILPTAINHGARVYTSAEVTAVRIEGGRATGLYIRAHDPADPTRTRDITVDADVVVVAGNAIHTPVILGRSGITNVHLGKHLAIHPGAPVVAEFDDPVQLWDGVPQGYYAHIPGEPDVTLETASIGLAELHLLFGGPGAAGAKQALRYPFFALAGPMIRDVGEGTVRADGRGRGVSYDFAPADVALFKKGVQALVRLYFAAGAKAVSPLTKPATFFTREADALAAVDAVSAATDFTRLHGSHPHGTARMGRDADDGVCDKNGAVFGTAGLHVADGSLFPSTLGVNPQVSIMALNLMLARRLVGQRAAAPTR